jgi:hypothetical protein
MAKSALILALLAAGCSSTPGSLADKLTVSVSAADYTQLSAEDLYARVNGPPSSNPSPPSVAHPDRPLFYAFVRGETFPSDATTDTVFRELAVPLARRGYFNILYEVEAGYRPNRIDYLLRINSGVRRWKTPVVRTDKVTWSDYGLVSERHNPRSAYLTGDAANADARAGSDANTALNMATFFQNQIMFGTQDPGQFSTANLADSADSRDYGLIVIEAFRFQDVVAQRNDAPCAWSVFVAVPLGPGQRFSGVLRALARAATPYFGSTTSGVQLFDVPAGKVLMGEPVPVPGSQATP